MAYRPALDKTFGSFSGSLGATLHVTESLLLRANIASAYRTPNLAELTSNGQHELRYEVGDRQLVPENAYESDLSLHYHRGNVTFDVAGFYNMVNNYIFIAPTGSSTPDGTAIYQYLQANSALYGGETGVHIHPQALPWLHLEAAYSTVTGKQSNGDYLPFVPAQKIRCEIRGERERLLFLNKAFASASTSTAFDQITQINQQLGSYQTQLISANQTVSQSQQQLASCQSQGLVCTSYEQQLTSAQLTVSRLNSSISSLQATLQALGSASTSVSVAPKAVSAPSSSTSSQTGFIQSIGSLFN